MEEVHPIPANNLDEKAIDILKCLIVRLKGLRSAVVRYRRTSLVEQPRKWIATGSSFREIRAVVRRSKKQNAVCRHVDGPQSFGMRVTE